MSNEIKKNSKSPLIISTQSDFIFINILLTLGYIIVIGFLFFIIPGDPLNIFKTVLVNIVTIIVIGLRFNISITIGMDWGKEKRKFLANHLMVYLVSIGIIDVFLIFAYFLFFWHSDVIIDPIVIDTVFILVLLGLPALAIGGIENLAFAFYIGLLAIQLFVDPSSGSLTGEFTVGLLVIFYSIVSTLVFSPFYLVPSLFIGRFEFKRLEIFLEENRGLKMIIISVIPFAIVLFIHLIIYSIIIV